MRQAGVKKVVIVGGGTAGWMAAAALGRILGGKIAIELIESDDISSVGVGESTIPMMRVFNNALGIDEDEFIRETRATFKLGIEFVDWGALGERYMHGFGRFGQDLGTVDFYQYWLKMHQLGKAPDLGRFSINQMAAREAKFMRSQPDAVNSPLADIASAFHIDAGLYAQYLRKYSEARGVRRTEGKVVEVRLDPVSGHVDAVRMENGSTIAGDLYIDCTGFRALLIEQALHTGFEDWSHWLPCDRAWVVPCAGGPELLPYTRATAREAGWQWRIGLQHRTGNGHVFASGFMSDEKAAGLLMSNLHGAPLGEPRLLKFGAGRCRKTWNRNVVAVGLSSGFLEPLESTSIYLIQSAISRLVTFFPDAGFDDADIDAFNSEADFEIERIRDFIILHYHATTRTDSDFWNYVRTMPVPDTLSRKLNLYKSHGRIVRENNELFTVNGWLQVMHGQGVKARGYHPLVDLLEESDVAAFLAQTGGVIEKCVDVMPTHAHYVRSIVGSGK